MKILILFSLLFSSSLMASKPTFEGLFRNGNNPDIGGELIVLNVIIQEMQNSEVLQNILVKDEEKMATESSPLMMAGDTKKRAIKFIFSLEKSERVGMIQLNYDDIKMENTHLKKVIYNPNLLETLKVEPKFERNLLYSLLCMVSLNEARPISNLMKKLDKEFTLISEGLNKEKLNLLKSYRDYLMAIQKDPNLKEKLNDPLRPIDPESKTKVDGILKSSLYIKNDKVKLFKKGKEFYWKIELENIEGLFSNEDNHLNELSLKTLDGESSVVFGDYILLDGIHEIPKEMIIKTTGNYLYKVELSEYKVYADSKKEFYKRAEEYQKSLNENKMRLEKQNATDAPVKEIDRISNTLLF